MNILKYLTTSAVAAAIAISSHATQAMEKPEPQITGRVVKSLRNLGEDFYVKVALNDTDPLARQDNIGKSKPIMLSNVKRLQENGTPFEGIIPHGILLDSGSHIEFKVRSTQPGRCGFGVSIITGKENIIESLYRVDSEGKNKVRVGTIRRYQDGSKTIKVDNFETMGIESSEEKKNYMTCQIDGWKVDSFTENGIMYPLPQRESAMVIAKVKGGAIHEGCESDSRFKDIYDVEDGDPLGSLTFKFFVFANPEAKDQFYAAYQDIKVDDF